MRYAAAYVLAALAGNSSPDVQTISKILGSVGVACDNTQAQKVIDACKGKNLEQVITEGTKKLSSMPTSGGAAAAASEGAAGAKKAPAKEEAKKEDKKAAKESDDEGGDDMVRDHSSAHVLIIDSCALGIWLVRLDPCQGKQTTHRCQSYLLRCLSLCVCFEMICYSKRRIFATVIIHKKTSIVLDEEKACVSEVLSTIVGELDGACKSADIARMYLSCSSPS